MRTKWSIAGAVLFVVTRSVSGCGSDDECTVKGTMELSLPADGTCPVDPGEAATELGRCVSSMELDGLSITLADSASEPAVTVCWYRGRFPACPNPDERRTLLERATTCERPVATDEGRIEGCDAEGTLLGQVAPQDAADCPAEISTTATPDGIVDMFVGRDVYPARVVCTYETTWTYACGRGCMAGFSPGLQ